nr:immunoglobulin heavy chain junction region [Macaca mulatta]
CTKLPSLTAVPNSNRFDVW